MKYIIYCTICLATDKVYIGRHRTDNPDVFDGYLGCGVKATMPSTYMNPRTAFQCAVKKYGPKAFRRVTLHVCDTLEEAVRREAKIVTPEFLMLDSNYNMRIGSGPADDGKGIYQFDANGNMVRHWRTVCEARDFFNCSMAAFSNALHFRETLMGYYWSRSPSIDIGEFSRPTPRKAVYKYLKTGKLIEQYSSASEAAMMNGITTSSLTTAIQGCCLVDGKFYYSYRLYESFVPRKKQSLRDRTFYLYDANGDYVTKFDDVKELMAFMGVKSVSSVHDVIHRRDGMYKDYRILLERVDNAGTAERRNRRKRVLVYDRTGRLLKECGSVQEAAREFNARCSSVNRVLRGLANTTAGCVFKYK